MSTLQVTVPEGAAAGMTIQAQAPSGQMVQVTIPDGVTPGQSIVVQIPDADTASFEPYEPLDDKRYDVTNTCTAACNFVLCPWMGWTTTTLLMTDQEVSLRTKNWCGASKQKRPYAQLGSVDEAQQCCGICSAFASDFAPVKENGEGGLVPGCGCEQAMVQEIVKELQMRKAKRGGIAQIRKLDYMLKKTAKIGTQVPIIADHFEVPIEKKQAPLSSSEIFPSKTIDATNWLEMIFACTSRELKLEAEEAILHINKCFGMNTIVSQREYGQLGFVEKQKNCVCCFQVASDLSPIPGEGNISPGCPCTNRTQVTSIVQELRERMAARGQVGQIRKQEKMLKMINDFKPNLLEVGKKVGASAPPQLQVMTEQGQEVSQQVEKKDYDITNTIDSCLNCVCTCGVAGCTTETMSLHEDDLFIITKNNLDDSNMKMPYAEMDSVDVQKSCCCCWSVNESSPGFGCNRALVEEIAEDLQQRKLKRGNIAHLKQLRNMQGTAAGLDALAEDILKREGIMYPPSQADINRVFGEGKTPKVLENPAVHVEPDQEFEEKKYSVTNYPESIAGLLCCQGWRTRTVELTSDEMLILTEDCCSRFQSRTPYGNVDAVESETACCCCAQLPDVATPGCGCSKELVDEMARELQERKTKRGAIAQIKQQENIIVEVLKLGVKTDLLIDKRSIAYPPAPEVMARVFLQP